MPLPSAVLRVGGGDRTGWLGGGLELRNSTLGWGGNTLIEETRGISRSVCSIDFGAPTGVAGAGKLNRSKGSGSPHYEEFQPTNRTRPRCVSSRLGASAKQSGLRDPKTVRSEPARCRGHSVDVAWS
jgi:hypothetical protein